MSKLKLDVLDERVVDILRAFGIPYAFGAGEPKHGANGWPPDPLPVGHGGGRGLDCSGLAGAALVHLGILPPTAPDRTAAGYFDLSKPIPTEMARLGDLAFYGQPGRVRHVTVCLGGGVILGANGGGAKTYGDNPGAFVKLDRVAYRSDFLGCRRVG